MGVQAFKRGGQGIMKKKAAFIIIEFLLLIFFILSNSLWIRISVFTIECLIIYLIFKLRQYNNYCKEKFPGYCNIARWNYDFLDVGNIRFNANEENILDITGVRRNLYTDILINRALLQFFKAIWYGSCLH